LSNPSADSLHRDTNPRANTNHHANTKPLGQPKSLLVTIKRGSRYLHIASCSGCLIDAIGIVRDVPFAL
jgi:hypothetical protein